MASNSVYEQISRRTDGNVYLGVVGPVRSGKSTFIKHFMEQLVIPNIEDPYRKERAQDELPQSASGRTIMTSEPKIIPEEAVQISPDGSAKLSIRMIDSVGYLIPGATGADEDGQPRMVTTPWADRELTMQEAAELGTKKVMEQHSSIGIVMTTDGSITDIPREDYLQAEQRAIADMQATGKPFVVLVNSENPQAQSAKDICKNISQTYGASCMCVNALTMQTEDIQQILQLLMEQFPYSEIRIFLPEWILSLDDENALKAELYDAIMDSAKSVQTLSEASAALESIAEKTEAERSEVRSADLGSGVVECVIAYPHQLFYQIISQESGFSVQNDGELMQLLREMGKMKREHDKVSAAIEQVYATGYGIVMPNSEEMELEQPELLKKNGSYAVRIRAKAPSIHMIRADVATELTPVIGNEQQSQEVYAQMAQDYEQDLPKLWNSNLFGKSIYDMVQDGLSSKAQNLPEDAKMKLRGTLSKVINENTGGLICIML